MFISMLDQLAPWLGQLVTIIIYLLAAVGAITCACMVADACHGLADWRRIRRKLNEIRNAPRAQDGGARIGGLDR